MKIIDPYLVPLGLVPGVLAVEMVGRNADVDTGTVPETIWGAGGQVGFRTVAAVVEVLSSDAADDGAPAGTGAQTIRVKGLDEDYEPIEETFTMNGVTAVIGTALFLRVNSVEVLTAGSGGTNAGNITVRDSVAGTTRNYIAAGRGRSESAFFTVPAGKILLLGAWIASATVAGAGSETQVDVMERRNAGSVNAFHVAWSMIVTSSFESPFRIPHRFPEKTDVEFRVTEVANSNTVVALHAHGMLVDLTQFP